MDVPAELVKRVNSRLKDEVSKEIFMNRLLFSLTGDYTYIKNIVITTECGKKMYEKMKKCGTPIGIFGAGRIGRKILYMYRDITFNCFIDNNKTGEFEGLPVLSLPDFMKKYPKGTVLISMREGHDIVEKQLSDSGISKERIINYGYENDHMSDHNQYFDLEPLWNVMHEREVFVDGGAYDGRNTKDFLNIVHSEKKREGFAYVWEPEESFLPNIDQSLLEYKGHYEVIKKGLWCKTDKVSFITDGVSSMIDKNGHELVEVDSIDNTISEPVSFIKMDIEGSEFHALSGAKETIRKYKPRLAISIYHRTEDILALPELIMELGQYDFYLRHYTLSDDDTVLYSVPVH